MERCLFFLLIALAGLAMAGCERSPAGGLPVVKMKIGSETFTLEVADTDTTRARGLMHRDSMPADHGMIFVFDTPQVLNFYMKNTRIPLDIIFVDSGGRVVSIAAMRPFDWSTTPSAAPARYAIELNQGAAARSGIAAGDLLDLSPVAK